MGLPEFLITSLTQEREVGDTRFTITNEVFPLLQVLISLSINQPRIVLPPVKALYDTDSGEKGRNDNKMLKSSLMAADFLLDLAVQVSRDSRSLGWINFRG